MALAAVPGWQAPLDRASLFRLLKCLARAPAGGVTAVFAEDDVLRETRMKSLA